VQVISLLQRYWPLDQLLIGRLVNYDVRMTSRPLTQGKKQPAKSATKRTPAAASKRDPVLTAPREPAPPARRKPPEERRTEIVQAASVLALTEGLESLTLRRVADALGVVPGLVNHYFRSVEDLVAEAFTVAAYGETSAVFRTVEQETTPLVRMRALIALLVTPDRDDISLLWLDAWQASRARPALQAAVGEQMRVWQQRVADLISSGVADGVFRNDNPAAAATRLMAVVDGLSVHAAMRSPVDYAVVRQLVIDSTERELGLRQGELEPSP
jgi:AcrR family transcriptional regulator